MTTPEGDGDGDGVVDGNCEAEGDGESEADGDGVLDGDCEGDGDGEGEFDGKGAFETDSEFDGEGVLDDESEFDAEAETDMVASADAELLTDTEADRETDGDGDREAEAVAFAPASITPFGLSSRPADAVTPPATAAAITAPTTSDVRMRNRGEVNLRDQLAACSLLASACGGSDAAGPLPGPMVRMTRCAGPSEAVDTLQIVQGMKRSKIMGRPTAHACNPRDDMRMDAARGAEQQPLTV